MLLSSLVPSPRPCLAAGFVVFAHPSVSTATIFAFSYGVHGLPIDSGRVRGVPRHCRLRDICHMGVVGDEHHFAFACPALDPVRQRFPHLFATGTRSLRLYIWQEDFCSVVHTISECFVV